MQAQNAPKAGQRLSEVEQSVLVNALRVAAQRSFDNADTVSKVRSQFVRNPNTPKLQGQVLERYRELEKIFASQGREQTFLADKISAAEFISVAAGLDLDGDVSDSDYAAARAVLLGERAPLAAHNGIEGELLSEGLAPVPSALPENVPA